jgi:hypothetical protein
MNSRNFDLVNALQIGTKSISALLPATIMTTPDQAGGSR